jgi:hypothetical protein
MRQFLFVSLMVFILASCSGNGTSTEAKVDSTINKIDSTAKAVFDSTKEKVKDIKSNLDSTFDKKDFK